MDLSATEARHVAEAERLRALLGDARQQKARIQRQITSVFETRQNLHVFDDGITENDDVVERGKFYSCSCSQNPPLNRCVIISGCPN